MSRARLSRLGPALLFVLAGCASEVSPPPATTVGEVSLSQSEQTPVNWKLLDIGIVIFTNSPDSAGEDSSGTDVFAEVRDNERHLLPSLLRSALVDSNQWGAIRVLPQEDPSVDLLIRGRIIESDGTRLALQVSAIDSTGRQWLNQNYRDETILEDFPEATAYRERRRRLDDFEDPFRDIYEQIANDLVSSRASMNAAALGEIRRVSELRYAADLAPDSFAYMLETDAAGRLATTTLPAQDDPMLRRVREMRGRHHLFIDTVDEYYQALHDDTRNAYLIWRRYSFDQLREEEAAEARLTRQSSSVSSAGFQSLRQNYDRYRWSKIYEQEFRELAAGFSNETAPAILELNSQVHGLSGTMTEQYGQWRRILRQLFALESLSPAP